MSALSGVVTGTVYSSNESNNYTPLDKCSLINAAVFSTNVGPVALSATYGESEPAVTTTSSNDRGNALGITFTDLGGAYTSGPLMTSLNVTVFGAVGTFAAIDGQVRTRLAGSYNAGVAKVGLGYQNKTGGAADQYAASITVPMGNLAFGVDYTARGAQGAYDKTAGYSTADFAKTGAYAAYVLNGSREGDKASSSLGLGVTYSFSKTTTLNASYITYTDAGANGSASAAVATTNAATLRPTGTTASMLDTEYRIRLMKAF
jgi:hypothetical protein